MQFNVSEKMVSPKTASRHALLEITRRCNLSCAHCFISAGKPLDSEMSVDAWRIAIDDLLRAGFSAFTLSGGEPLLEPNKTFSIAEQIRNFNAKHQTYLFSNLSLLDEEHLPRIKELFSGVMTSLDGDEAAHNQLRRSKSSYKTVLEKIQLLADWEIPVGLQSMITPFNGNSVEHVAQVAEQLGVRTIRFSFSDYIGRSIANWSNLSFEGDIFSSYLEKLDHLAEKYDVHIVSDLVRRDVIEKNQKGFQKFFLHLLPNGFLLPVYGVNSKYRLVNYPGETLEGLDEKVLMSRVSEGSNLLRTAVERVTSSGDEVVDFDCVVGRLGN
jgi:MoaA/NifB/PqqE/SkfB family radical SAM enzyme